MNLRRASGAALFLAGIFLQSGCVSTVESVMPAGAPGVESHASRPKELPADRTAELCQAAAEELEKQGLNADAVTQYEKARRLDPKRVPVVARRLAVLYDRLGDDAHALADYKEALAAAPHDADLLNDFGYYHYQRGELDEAEKCFRQALESNHAHLRAAVNLGLTLGKEGKADSSLEAFRQVLPASEAYCNVGVLLAQQGKAVDARHSLEEALHLEPGMKQARLVLDHLDEIASAAPTSRPPAVAGAPVPPPVLQAAAPTAPPVPRQASYVVAPPSALHQETAIPIAPPAHRPVDVAVAPPPIQQGAAPVIALPPRQASYVVAPPPAPHRETSLPAAPPAPRPAAVVVAPPPVIQQVLASPVAPPPPRQASYLVTPPQVPHRETAIPVAQPAEREVVIPISLPPAPSPQAALPAPPPAPAPLLPVPRATIMSVQPADPY